MATGLTINLQGSFTSTGAIKTLNLPSGLDSLWVYNKTVQYAAGAGNCAEAFWNTTMTSGRGTQYVKEATIGALVSSQFAVGAGFTLVDTSLSPISGATVATTAVSAGNPPVVSTGSTAGVAAGTVVRLYNMLGTKQLSSMDFTVGTVVANTSFQLAYMQPVVVSALAGAYNIVNWQSKFYPRRRYITNITSSGATTIVTMSVTHSFTVGQQVRLIVPVASSGSAAFGMYQINGMAGNIIATTQTSTVNTITLDIDSSGFSAFVFPLTADYPITFAEVVPVGENTAVSLASSAAQKPLDYFGNPIPNANSGILADATVDTSLRGIALAGGANSPAGQANDFIMWSAMVAYSVDPNS